MEDYDLIETPENVKLERRLAGIGSRFTAGVLDTIYLVLVYLVVLVVAIYTSGFDLFSDSGEDSPDTWALALLILVGFAVYWFYFAFFEMVLNGQSPGKRSVQIRVVKDGGGAITFSDIAIRNLLRAVDCLGLYAVAGICMFATKKMQRLGDLAAGTIVVSEQLHDYRARTDKGRAEDWEQSIEAGVLRGSGLTTTEYRILANYWARREQLSLEARQQLLPRLVLPILQRMGTPAPDESHEALEEFVLAWLEGVASAEVRAANRTDEREDAR